MTVVFLAAALVSVLGTGAILPWLRTVGFMDTPNFRSSHVVPTPRGGGVSVVVALFVASGIAVGRGYQINGWILVGILIFAGLGLADDVRGLNVPMRLATQVVVASGVSVVVLRENLSLSPYVGALAIVGGTLWLAGYTNAFNFMDGVNGISALNAAIAGLWFLYVGLSHDLDAVAALGSAVAGSALGFLPWNAPKAMVFLGDVGSYALGFVIGSLALLTWAAGVSAWIATPPLVIYIIDTGSALTRRVLGRRSWREAHREHIYQRLMDSGWGHLGSALTCASASALICAWAYTLARATLPEWWLIPGIALIGFTYMCLPTGLDAWHSHGMSNVVGTHPGGDA